MAMHVSNLMRHDRELRRPAHVRPCVSCALFQLAARRGNGQLGDISVVSPFFVQTGPGTLVVGKRRWNSLFERAGRLLTVERTHRGKVLQEHGISHLPQSPRATLGCCLSEGLGSAYPREEGVHPIAPPAELPAGQLPIAVRALRESERLLARDRELIAVFGLDDHIVFARQGWRIGGAAHLRTVQGRGEALG